MIRTIDMTAPFSFNVEGVAHATGTGGTDPTELETAAQPVIHRPTGAYNTSMIIPPNRLWVPLADLGERQEEEVSVIRRCCDLEGVPVIRSDAQRNGSVAESFAGRWVWMRCSCLRRDRVSACLAESWTSADD